MATIKRFITYIVKGGSGEEEWIRQTLLNSLLPEDGIVIFKNKSRIDITTIKDPLDSKETYKFRENKDG